MITTLINNYRVHQTHPQWSKAHLINSLIRSRNLFNVQTLEYDIVTVCSMDIDESGNFLLVGLSNGAVDLLGIQDPSFGTLDNITRFNFSPFNLHRVQWSPSDEQFFSMLDNHNLYLVDPVEMRTIERFNFGLKTNWSEWNPSDKKMIAVCGSESQVRLADICSGSSIQTIVLGSRSGLASHRATRCLWSRQDLNCLIVGDNEGYLHVYDTRHSTRPLILVGEERGQISGMSFTSNQNSIITSQGTENQLVQWSYDKCSLVPSLNKFRKRKEVGINPLKIDESNNNSETKKENGHSNNGSSFGSSALTKSSSKNPNEQKGILMRKHSRRLIPLPVDAYLRCQFYVTDRHIYCPVPSRVTKSKEIYIYDIESGDRIKTLKSEDILRQGVYSVTGLLPESLVLYVGGRGRLRVWSVDEDHQKKMEEKVGQYHISRWDSDDEL